MKCGELCLIGTKGAVTQLIKSHKVRGLIESTRTKHSEKPEEARNRIVNMFGNLPRIELFARQITPGWTCLGNEISGKDIREELAEML